MSSAWARRGGLSAVVVFLLACGLVASPFFVPQIGFQSLFLGIVALSLIVLASYGGMVSLAQTALYGVAGYTVAIVTATYGAPWYAGVIAALMASDDWKGVRWLQLSC